MSSKNSDYSDFVKQQKRLIRFYKQNADQKFENEWLFAVIDTKVLEKILGYVLSDQENTTKHSMMMICKRWNRVFWRLCILHSGDSIGIQRELTESCPYLAVLTIEGKPYKVNKHSVTLRSGVFSAVLSNPSWKKTDNYQIELK